MSILHQEYLGKERWSEHGWPGIGKLIGVIVSFMVATRDKSRVITHTYKGASYWKSAQASTIGEPCIFQWLQERSKTTSDEIKNK